MHILPEQQFMASDKRTAFGEHRPSHRIDFYALVWFTETKGVHYIDFERYPIKRDMVYFIGKNQIHSIPSKALPKAKTIVFPESFFHRIEEPFLRQLFLPFENEGVQIPAKMLPAMNQLFDLILLECRSEADLNMLLKYMTAFLLHLYRFGQHRFSVAAGEDTRMVKLFQLMESHYKENRSAGFYARQIGLTTKRINEILREKAGMTMSQLLYQLLLIEAKRELFHGEFSIKEIAYNLGFTDQSYFARFFKKHTGLTPEQFRQKEGLHSRP